jgi:hypothetical protein
MRHNYTTHFEPLGPPLWKLRSVPKTECTKPWPRLTVEMLMVEMLKVEMLKFCLNQNLEL